VWTLTFYLKSFKLRTQTVARGDPVFLEDRPCRKAAAR
jgi:hypothetical protein